MMSFSHPLNINYPEELLLISKWLDSIVVIFQSLIENNCLHVDKIMLQGFFFFQNDVEREIVESMEEIILAIN